MLMRKIGRHKRKKQKNFLIIGSLSLLLFLCVGYAAFSTNLSITAKGNVKEKSRVIQAWEENSQTDFHLDFYKQNIVSATFLDNNSVPSSAVESWNVSEDKENGSVMAWVIPNNNDNTKYDLYIGAPAGVIANEDSGYVFYDFTLLNNIEFNSNFNTVRVTNLEGMFRNCLSIETLNLSSFNTSNVTNMHEMFYNCDKIQSLDLSNFDTSNVTNMVSMFLDCDSLLSLDVKNFNTSNVTTMEAMFGNCDNIESIDVSNFDTSNVTNMRDMFSYNPNLKSITGLEDFNTSNVTNMIGMFNKDSKLEQINLCSFDTSKVIDMHLIFADTSSLKVVYVGTNWATENADVTNMFLDSAISSVTTGQC